LSSPNSSTADTNYPIPPIQEPVIRFTPRESRPDGLPYEEHVKNFWQYIISIPKNNNPWHDGTGANCANGQSGKNSSVFYLSGNGGGVTTRICRVPARKRLLIPVMAVEMSEKEAPNASEAQLRDMAKKDQDSVTSLYLRIGNKVYDDEVLRKYRLQPTEPFDVTFPDNGIFGVRQRGDCKAVADGFYIITEPIEEGTYTIHYKSSLSCVEEKGQNCIDFNHDQDITYTIIAERDTTT
jgi:hypothetical protein